MDKSQFEFETKYVLDGKEVSNEEFYKIFEAQAEQNFKDSLSWWNKLKLWWYGQTE